jgi:hypothetical protein
VWVGACNPLAHPPEGAAELPDPVQQITGGVDRLKRLDGRFVRARIAEGVLPPIEPLRGALAADQTLDDRIGPQCPKLTRWQQRVLGFDGYGKSGLVKQPLRPSPFHHQGYQMDGPRFRRKGIDQHRMVVIALGLVS